MKVKFKIVTIPWDCGDGSTATKVFSTKEKAEAWLNERIESGTCDIEPEICVKNLELDTETGLISGERVDPEPGAW